MRAIVVMPTTILKHLKLRLVYTHMLHFINRKLLPILSLIASQWAYAQNPYGVYVDIDGKVKLWEAPLNFNGNLDDTVLITSGNEVFYEDLRNVLYTHLTFLEPPSDYWTIPSNLDPSRHYDTTATPYPEKPYGLTYFWYDTSRWQFTAPINVTVETTTPPVNKYIDEEEGANLTEINMKKVKALLNNYITTYQGKIEPYEARDSIHQALSYPDSIVDKIACFDYLVDRLILHDYDSKQQLTRVVGYHWSLGVEVDKLKYNNQGNITYFCREKIGTLKYELFFSYNQKQQVVKVKRIYNSVGNTNETSYTHPDVITTKFTYAKTGFIYTASTQINKTKTTTCTFSFSKKLL